ncbi:11408_t:CDS:2 [Funneliformis geosporum]|nr:11408_t:CDS:2 [Funneliformis geosporum]
MPPKPSKQSTSRGRSKLPVANRPLTKKSLTLNTLPPPELMDTEPISSFDNSSKDKGKNPETILDED